MFDESGTQINETTIDEDGLYVFDELEYGIYTVEVDVFSAPSRIYPYWPPASSYDNTDDHAVTFTLDEPLNTLLDFLYNDLLPTSTTHVAHSVVTPPLPIWVIVAPVCLLATIYVCKRGHRRYGYGC